MRGWRTKFIFMLIVYFAGFATAIYILAPTPENHPEKSSAKGFLDSTVKSGNFVASFNSGMHKCVETGKEAAWRTAKFLKRIANEAQTDSSS